MDLYNTLVQPFVDYFNEGKFFDNDFAVAGVLATTLTFVLMRIRSLPEVIWNRLKRHLFYSVTVEQNDELYNLVCRYLDLNFPEKNRRSQAITKEPVTNVYESEDAKKLNTILFTPLVDSFFIFKDFLKVSKERDKLDNAKDHDMVYFNKIQFSGIFAKGRIQRFLEKCYELKEVGVNGEFLVKEYYLSYYSEWALKSTSNSVKCAVKKSVDHIFFPEKDGILEMVDRFQNSKDRYEKASVDWYMGILLHGKAGSGKTSFARSLAKYTKRNLYTLNLSTARDAEFKKSFVEIPTGSILLLDDVDVCINGRDDKNEGVNLSTLLSCLDGNESRSDLIVVMTTNRIDVLDEALIRKGRVDLIEEVSYPDKKSIEDFIKYFYKVDSVEVKEGEIDFSMVEVQHLCLNNEDIQTCVEKVNSMIRETKKESPEGRVLSMEEIDEISDMTWNA